MVGELDVVNEDPSAAGDGAGQGDAEEDNTRVVLKVPIPLCVTSFYINPNKLSNSTQIPPSLLPLTDKTPRTKCQCQ